RATVPERRPARRRAPRGRRARARGAREEAGRGGALGRDAARGTQSQRLQLTPFSTGEPPQRSEPLRDGTGAERLELVEPLAPPAALRCRVTLAAGEVALRFEARQALVDRAEREVAPGLGVQQIPHGDAVGVATEPLHCEKHEKLELAEIE